MNKSIVFFLFLLFLTGEHLLAQDLIILKTGNEIAAKVFEVNPETIRYKRSDNPEGPDYKIPVQDVLSVKYASGAKEVFVSPPESSNGLENLSEAERQAQGREDAKQYYKDWRGASTGTLVTSILSPVYGLIPAIACSVTPPEKRNLNAPNEGLLQDPFYFKGYRAQAHSIKAGKVWKNWAIPTGVWLVVTTVIVTTLFSDAR